MLRATHTQSEATEHFSPTCSKGSGSVLKERASGKVGGNERGYEIQLSSVTSRSPQASCSCAVSRPSSTVVRGTPSPDPIPSPRPTSDLQPPAPGHQGECTFSERSRCVPQHVRPHQRPQFGSRHRLSRTRHSGRFSAYTPGPPELSRSTATLTFCSV